ncbi:MAG TPA: TonB-dependent receptor plug domain-containing protein, partial [Chitinophagaceae bacterium]|nr:TonB-dependent receptor plug domain-containing protein [Chitinophagaceae bacterium]
MKVNVKLRCNPGFKKLMLSVLAFSFFLTIQAQTVSGTVSEAGKALPGVTVTVKGKQTATTTDAAGKFSINAAGSDVLVFTSVGYATKEVAIKNNTSLTVELDVESQVMGEVIVTTALGINKQARSLGYSTTNVNPAELTVNRSPNVMNALQGKVAGLNISALGTGPNGTSKIRIRGQSSISGQNNPLIVIDGVPIDNTNFGSNPVGSGSNSDGSYNNRLGGGGGGNTSDGGDGLQSINPDDIESMSILKGAAASALYGARAKDGVIMITTKSRPKAKGIGVTYNLNYTDEAPLDFTDYQYEYGQGESNLRPTAPKPTSGQWSFGEKFQPGMTQVLFNGVTVPYEPQHDHITNFYRHGQNITNTISMAVGGEKGGLNLSLGNLDSKGITPNNTFKRKTINLGFGYDLTNKLSFAGNINYANE